MVKRERGIKEKLHERNRNIKELNTKPVTRG